MGTELIRARHAQIVAEREQVMLRQILSDRQAGQRIERLQEELARASAARAAAQASWEKDDHAYAAVIGELGRLLETRPPKEDPDGL